jgi:cytosine/adenosine deaminase-related metal-dependent hydrolase
MAKELLIKGGHVVTVDPDLGDLPAGDVLVADGLIVAVGPDLEPTTTAAGVGIAAGRQLKDQRTPFPDPGPVASPRRQVQMSGTRRLPLVLDGHC